jgi:K+-sensing histidine kinase KdpD
VNSDQFRPAPVSLHAVLSNAIARTAEFAESRDVFLNLPSAGAELVLGDERLLVRALQALLETAVKFSGKGKTVQITRNVSASSPAFIIETSGLAIPATALPKFFDLFSIGLAITPGGDLGLGPSMAHRILSLFNASVSVQNLEPPGIRLTIALEDAATGQH